MPDVFDQIESEPASTGDIFDAVQRQAGARQYVSQKVEEYPVLEPGYASEIARGLTQFVPAGIKTISTVGHRLFGPSEELPEAQPIYKFGQRLEDAVNRAYPPVPEPQRHLGHDVATGLGQVGSMIAGGMAAKGVGATAKAAAVVSTALGGVQEFDDAFGRSRQRGDDPDTAFAKSLGYATVAGLIENKFGAGRILKKYFPDPAEAAKKLTALGVSKAIATSLAVGFGEEGSQRFTQNLIVEGKPSFEGVVQEGAPGGIVQAIAELPATLLRVRGGRIRQGQAQEEQVNDIRIPKQPATGTTGEIEEAGALPAQRGQPPQGGAAAQAQAGTPQPQGADLIKSELELLNARARALGASDARSFNTQHAINFDSLDPERQKLLTDFSNLMQSATELSWQESVKLGDTEFGRWEKRRLTTDVNHENEMRDMASLHLALNERGNPNAGEVLARLQRSKKKSNWTVEAWKQRTGEDATEDEIKKRNEDSEDWNDLLQFTLQRIEKLKQKRAAPKAVEEPWYVTEQKRVVANLGKQNVDAIEELAAQRKTAGEIARELGLDVNDVRAARASRGIPGLDAGNEFDEWLRKRSAPPEQGAMLVVIKLLKEGAELTEDEINSLGIADELARAGMSFDMNKRVWNYLKTQPPKTPLNELLSAAEEWDRAVRHGRGDAWFEGGKITASQAFNEALQEGGDQLQAHGMSKEWTLGSAIKNLLGLLETGLDPKRRGGRLDTAPLVARPGEGLVGATPGGTAYSDGPFMIVQRPGTEGLTGKLENAGAILVNPAHEQIIPQLRAILQATRPDIIVDSFSNAGQVTKSILGKQKPTVTPPPRTGPVASSGKIVTVSTPEPNGAVVEAEIQFWPKEMLMPLVSKTPGEFQNILREGVKASKEQMWKIALETDWNQVGENLDTSLLGPPVIDTKVVAGNNRSLGMMLGYSRNSPTMRAYEQKVRETAAAMGVNIDDITDPVMVRVVRSYKRGDRASFVRESNKMHVSLPPSQFQKAMDDAAALKLVMPLSDYPLTETGNLDKAGVVAGNKALASRGLERDNAGRFDVNELNARFKLAVLVDLAAANNFPVAEVARLLQSDEGRKAVNEMIRFAPRMAKLDADLLMVMPWLEALGKLQEGVRSVNEQHAYNSIAEWNAERHNELLPSGLSPEADYLLDQLVLSKDKPTLIREIFNTYLGYAENEQRQRRAAAESGDIFAAGPRANVPAASIFQRAKVAPVATTGAGGPPSQPNLPQPAAKGQPSPVVQPAQPSARVVPPPAAPPNVAVAWTPVDLEGENPRIDISTVVIQPGQERTFLAAAKAYFTDKRSSGAQKSRSTIRNTRGFLNSLLNELPALSTADLSKMTDDEVKAMMEGYFNPIYETVGATERGKGSEALRGRIREFQAVMNYAKAAWDIPAKSIVWSRARLKPISKAAAPYLGITGDQLTKLVEIFRRDLGKGTKAAADTLEFIVSTGLRVSSAMMLRWSDVNWKDGTLRVTHYKGSGGGERTKFVPRQIYLTPYALSTLKRMRSERKGEPETAYLLKSSLIAPQYEADGKTRRYGGSEERGTDTGHFITALKAAGIKAGIFTTEDARGLTIHWLRSVFQNFAKASWRGTKFYDDANDTIGYLRIETSRDLKASQGKYDAKQLARIKAAAKLIRFDFDPGFEDLTPDEDEASDVAVADVAAANPPVAPVAEVAAEDPEVVFGDLKTGVKQSVWNAMSKEERAAAVAAAHAALEGQGNPPIEEEATVGTLKLGVSKSQYNEMAGYNDAEQMARWGTTRAKLIEDAVMRQPPQNPAPAAAPPAPPAAPPVAPQPPAAPVGMTPQQQSRYANLIRIERAAEKGGQPMSDAQRAELAELRAIGVNDLPGMPPKPPGPPKQDPLLSENPEGWRDVDGGEQMETPTRQEVLAAVAKENTFGFPVNVITYGEGKRMLEIESEGSYILPDAAGMFYDGQIYLFYDNMPKAFVRQTIREEAAHGLLRTAEGSQLLMKFLSFTDEDLQKIRDIAPAYENASDEQLLHEFVAKAARENLPWWQRLLEAVKAYLSRFGLQLTNEEAARALLREIQTRISKSGNATLPGEPEFAINATEPSADGADDRINIAGRRYNILGKDRMTPQQKAKGAQQVIDLFSKLKLPGGPDPTIGRGRGSTDSNAIWLVDPAEAFTSGGGYEAEGNQLADETLKQILAQDGPGGDQVYVSQLINAINKNFVQGNWNGVFSDALIDKLMALTLSEASYRGQLLRSLTGLGDDIESVARNLNFYLRRTLSDQFGGAEVRRLMEQVLVHFRDWIKEDELKNIITKPGDAVAREQLERLISRVHALNRKEEGGRVYRFIQRLFTPKFAKTLARMEKDARVIEAVNKIVEDLKKKGVFPKPPVGKKNLTAIESLVYMANPETAAKIDDAIGKAIHEGYMNAGMKYALDQAAAKGGPDARADLEQDYALGKEPTKEEINEGLKHAEYAHWKTLKENLAGYNPITIAHAQKIVSETFKGTVKDNIYGKDIVRPADTRIEDLYRLAQDPDAKKQEVINAFLFNISANLDEVGVDTEEGLRILRIVSEEVQKQLDLAQKRVRDNFFEPVQRMKASTPAERVSNLLNAKLAKDSRFRTNPVIELLRRASQRFAKASQFDDVATWDRDSKSKWVRDTGVQLVDSIDELAALPEDDDFRLFAEQVIFNDLATRLQAAESRLVRRILDGKDARLGNEPIDQEGVVKRLEGDRQRLAGAINAGLVDSSMVDALVLKQAPQSLLPTLSQMVQQALRTPIKDQEDIFTNFAEQLVHDLRVDPAVADKAKELMKRAYAAKFKEARKVALERSIGNLTPTELRVLKGRRARWRVIEEAVNAGAMDDLPVLQAIANRNKWTPVTDAIRNKFKTILEQMDSLRKLNTEELAKVGADPLDKERALIDKLATTQGELIALKKKLESQWSTITAPINLRTREGRKNALAAANEWTSANLLLRFGFLFKQFQDIFTQALLHTPTRALGLAMDRYEHRKAAGLPTEFWKDANTLLGDAYKIRFAHWRETLATSALALKGQSDARNVERLLSGVAPFDRMENAAQEASENGQNAWSFMLRILGALKLSYRAALAFDNLHGTPAEWQEMRQQAYQWLRAQGIPANAASLQLDNILGDAKAEYYNALETAKAYFATNGLDPSPTKIRGAAANISKARAYQRLRELGMPADNFEETGRQLRNVIGWNEKETGGLGGIVAGAMRKGRELAVNAGEYPLLAPLGAAGSLLNFGNAIGTSINRLLTFAGGGFFPTMFGVDPKAVESGEPSAIGSPWYRTQADRTQRRMEATAGLAVGGTLLALAMMGIIRVRNKWPKDKEEREVFERQGHRPGTIEIPYGNGFAAISMTSGPLAMVRPYLAAGGALHDLMQDRQKAQDKLNAEAAKRGLTPGKVDPVSYSDMLGVAGETALAAVTGGRTASGLIGAVSDYGIPNLKKLSANVVAPYVPGLPAIQEISRMAGTRLDAKMASFTDFLLPLPTSGAAAVNMFGDKVGTPNDLQRVIQTLTGGNYPYVPNEDNNESAPYRALFETGYRPPSISSTKGYEINGEIRPLTDEELVKYTKLRGQYMKQTIGALGAGATKADARSAYQQANTQALQEIGVNTEKPTATATQASGSRGTATRISTSAAPASAGRSTPTRFRSSNLRGFTRTRLTGGRRRRTTVRRGRIRSSFSRSSLRGGRRQRIRQYV